MQSREFLESLKETFSNKIKHYLEMVKKIRTLTKKYADKSYTTEDAKYVDQLLGIDEFQSEPYSQSKMELLESLNIILTDKCEIYLHLQTCIEKESDMSLCNVALVIHYALISNQYKQRIENKKLLPLINDQTLDELSKSINPKLSSHVQILKDIIEIQTPNNKERRTQSLPRPRINISPINSKIHQLSVDERLLWQRKQQLTGEEIPTKQMLDARPHVILLKKLINLQDDSIPNLPKSPTTREINQANIKFIIHNGKYFFDLLKTIEKNIADIQKATRCLEQFERLAEMLDRLEFERNIQITNINYLIDEFNAEVIHYFELKKRATSRSIKFENELNIENNFDKINSYINEYEDFLLDVRVIIDNHPGAIVHVLNDLFIQKPKLLHLQSLIESNKKEIINYEHFFEEIIQKRLIEQEEKRAESAHLKSLQEEDELAKFKHKRKAALELRKKTLQEEKAERDARNKKMQSNLFSERNEKENEDTTFSQDFIDAEMQEKLIKLKTNDFNLLSNFASKKIEKSIKEADVKRLLNILEVSIDENGGSHKSLAGRGVIKTVWAEDPKDIPNEFTAPPLVAKGGMFGQHHSGHRETDLVTDNQKLLSKYCETAGITSAVLLKIAKKREERMADNVSKSYS